MIVLEYYREYPTMMQMSTRWKGVHESTISRNIAKTEVILIKNNLFHLPIKKLEQADIAVVDEITISRPKKTKTTLFRKKEKAHFQSPNHCR